MIYVYLYFYFSYVHQEKSWFQAPSTLYISWYNIPKDPDMSYEKGFPLYSYSGDGIQTINPTLGKRLDS